MSNAPTQNPAQRFLQNVRAIPYGTETDTTAKVETTIDAFCREREELHFGSDVENLISALQLTLDTLRLSPYCEAQDLAAKVLLSRIRRLQGAQLQRRFPNIVA